MNTLDKNFNAATFVDDMESALSFLSDMYKDVHGIRPTWKVSHFHNLMEQCRDNEERAILLSQLDLECADIAREAEKMFERREEDQFDELSVMEEIFDDDYPYSEYDDSI
jgi:hypothetical protein